MGRERFRMSCETSFGRNLNSGVRESHACVFSGAVRSETVSYENRFAAVATHPHANALVDRASGENVGIVLVPVNAQNFIVVRLDRVHRTFICTKRNNIIDVSKYSRVVLDELSGAMR